MTLRDFTHQGLCGRGSVFVRDRNPEWRLHPKFRFSICCLSRFLSNWSVVRRGNETIEAKVFCQSFILLCCRARHGVIRERR